MAKFFKIKNIFSYFKNKRNSNELIIVDKNGNKSYYKNINGLNVNFSERNSSVIIHEPINFSGCNFDVGGNSRVEIFSSAFPIRKLRIMAKHSAKIVIGKNFLCRGCSILNHDESNMQVNIGEDCMFSYGIHIRVSDGHTVYSTEDNQILNKPKSGIFIGNHVWLGMNVTILKDVEIPNNSIIGANSLVNKTFLEENTIIAGIPANIIKRNINWLRESTEKAQKILDKKENN